MLTRVILYHVISYLHFYFFLFCVAVVRMFFSYLQEHKYKHNLQDNLHSFCSFWYLKSKKRLTFLWIIKISNSQTLFDSLSQIDDNLFKLYEKLLIDTLLFGNAKYSVFINSKVLRLLFFFTWQQRLLIWILYDT